LKASRLLLIHPIGVGLSSRFWDRFISCGRSSDETTALLAPDLLGCGRGEHANQQLAPEDWAAPLIDLLREHNNAPAVLVSQGASLPIALAVIETAPELVAGLVAINPPSWRILEESFPKRQSQLLWRLLFQGPIGSLFYRYARRRAFLKSFSINNLFASHKDVDSEWLGTLGEEATNMTTRWATFSFLAGFWRRNWTNQWQEIKQPTWLVFGLNATGIGRSKYWDDAQERIQIYKQQLPNAVSISINGRNVLPYESTAECVTQLQDWLLDQ
jgi:pimeloyl-ACP methyl ester carboxylesterase